MEHITEIILSIVSFVTSAGFIVSRTQLRKNKAQAEKEELDLSTSYVESFKQNIYAPLQQELKRLRESIEKINVCPYRGDCPVAAQLFCSKETASDSDN